MTNNKTNQSSSNLSNIYGCHYYKAGDSSVISSREKDIYTFIAHIGEADITIDAGDCVYWISEDKQTAHISRGKCDIKSSHLATIIRGYSPPNKSSSLNEITTLPYVNGCSTRQIFPPDRIGDPTLQLLSIPPHSSEQVHHIHSTARVVYVIKGNGHCVVGMDKKSTYQDLSEGMSIILHPMCPHHFETNDDYLLVLPLHVFSSAPGGIELNHPMFNGTHNIG